MTGSFAVWSQTVNRPESALWCRCQRGSRAAIRLRGLLVAGGRVHLTHAAASWRYRQPEASLGEPPLAAPRARCVATTTIEGV